MKYLKTTYLYPDTNREFDVYSHTGIKNIKSAKAGSPDSKYLRHEIVDEKDVSESELEKFYF